MIPSMGYVGGYFCELMRVLTHVYQFLTQLPILPSDIVTRILCDSFHIYIFLRSPFLLGMQLVGIRHAIPAFEVSWTQVELSWS